MEDIPVEFCVAHVYFAREVFIISVRLNKRTCGPTSIPFDSLSKPCYYSN